MVESSVVVKGRPPVDLFARAIQARAVAFVAVARSKAASAHAQNEVVRQQLLRTVQ
jgi:hypothetical protein